jgi:predicted MPP superfamily phosphohydrolase
MPSRKRLSRRDFLRLSRDALLSLIAAGTGSLLYASLAEPRWLDMETVDIPVAGLPESFDGFRLLQLTDFHMGGWMNRERLREVAELIKDHTVDLVVMTGDYVFGHTWTSSLDAAMDDFIAEISPLTTQTPTLAVLGNHDYWTDAEKVRVMLSQARITELRNDVYIIRKDSDAIHICGVDDIWEGKEDLGPILDKLPPSGVAVLLAHEPDFADESAATGRFCLQLSGHSHGGQVVLPFLGPPILPRLGRKYPSGLYKVREMWQYTNRGVGMIEPAIRFNCRPEITLLTLKAA